MQSEDNNSSGKKPNTTIAILLAALVFVLTLGIIANTMMRSEISGLRQQIAVLDKQSLYLSSIPLENSPSPIPSEPPSTISPISTTSILPTSIIEPSSSVPDNGWIKYENDKYDISFSYPSDYEITKDEMVYDYPDNPNDWYRIELKHKTATEEPLLIFEIDPDGYGPFFPERTYEISENSSGKIQIDSETDVPAGDYNYQDDGKVLIIPGNLHATNGHYYSWKFYYNEGGEDHEQDLRDILTTFKVLYNPEALVYQDVIDHIDANITEIVASSYPATMPANGTWYVTGYGFTSITSMAHTYVDFEDGHFMYRISAHCRGSKHDLNCNAAALLKPDNGEWKLMSGTDMYRDHPIVHTSGKWQKDIG